MVAFAQRERERRCAGNDFVKDRVALYWHVAQSSLAGSVGPVLSFVSDATRAGGKDFLFSALYSPRGGFGFWLPPQVSRSAPAWGATF
eukprot:1289499-Lingulodinium_polyedra.AAC.1